jgi:hypothetical protein
MDARYHAMTTLARQQHGALSTAQLETIGVHRRLRSSWTAQGLLEPRGSNSWILVGQSPTWRRDVWCGQTDVVGVGFVAGRSSARLHRLDGFTSDRVELLVTRAARGRRTPFDLRSTRDPLTIADTVVVDGIRCLSPERTILTSALFDFSRSEVENAIDSAIRLRLVSEQRLRTRAVAGYRHHVNGSRVLLDALVDSGGESRLERWFLKILRNGGLPRPMTQRVFRADGHTVARVDAWFPGDLVVEVEGHGTHSSRRQRQHDEERRSALMLRGCTVIVFTYLDVTQRPGWVASQVRTFLAVAA